MDIITHMWRIIRMLDGSEHDYRVRLLHAGYLPDVLDANVDAVDVWAALDEDDIVLPCHLV